MSEFTPLRSVLYMPSSNERALEKAKSIACDGLILDLEDAVSPDAKSAARESAAAAAASGVPRMPTSDASSAAPRMPGR
jgi:citrate lyase subunit beta/citryl-CoA lyase